MIEKLTIIGAGLLGASLGMCAKERNLTKQISVWGRNQQKLDICSRQSWCDLATIDLEFAVKDADLIVLCTPVNVILQNLKDIKPYLSTEAIVTDVGSTKAVLMRQAAEIYRDDQFVGSHPMAGSDKSGIEYADSQLYEGRACIITPMQGKKPSQNCEKLADFWSGLGMKVGLMDAEEHDRMVASISHLPHLVSSILCHELGESQIESWLPYSGKGLWDTSRVGGGDPSMWCDIIDQNQEAILAKLRSYKEQLNHFEKLVEENKQEEIHAYLKQGQAFRRTLESIKNVND